MTEFVSVDEAISKGHKVVNFPVMAINAGVVALTVYLGVQKLIPIWGYFIGLILGFVLSWLWWSFKIAKWRVWAFENVRNVHELKKRAIQERLIWPDGHFFEKTEIWSAADREREPYCRRNLTAKINFRTTCPSQMKQSSTTLRGIIL